MLSIVKQSKVNSNGNINRIIKNKKTLAKASVSLETVRGITISFIIKGGLYVFIKDIVIIDLTILE